MFLSSLYDGISQQTADAPCPDSPCSLPAGPLRVPEDLPAGPVGRWFPKYLIWIVLLTRRWSICDAESIFSLLSGRRWSAPASRAQRGVGMTPGRRGSSVAVCWATARIGALALT